MKIIIAPDSFKGTLSAQKAASIIEAALINVKPDIRTVKIPVADGGEGTAASLCGKIINMSAKNAFFEETAAYFGEFSGAALVESAVVCGLPSAAGREDPSAATTFGIGQLVGAALDAGYSKIIIALGGSCTNDAGCGMAAALGARFIDNDGRAFVPTGATLDKIKHIDMSRLDGRIKSADIEAMCDVKNPLFGENGAAFVFAPQKGADAEMVKRLDAGLRHIAGVIRDDLGLDVSAVEGGGAAGGMGAGVCAFLGGRLTSGIDIVLGAADFDKQLKDADLVITGEGRFDGQSLCGKVISGIARRTKKAGVPLAVIAGSVRAAPGCYEAGVTAMFSIQREPLPYEEAVLRTEENLRAAAENIFRIFLAGRLN